MKQYFNIYPETYNYVILAIVFITITMKILHDYFHYKRDLAYDKEDYEKAVKYGGLYHPFGFLMMVVPAFLGLFKLEWLQFLYAAAGFVFIYHFYMNLAFNILRKKNWLYIGKTSFFDKKIRKMFGISYKGDTEFELLSAKEIQRMNFRKAIIFATSFVIAVVGVIIIIDLI